VTVVDLSAGAPRPVPFGTPGHDPVTDLWARLRRPFDPPAVLAALTGLSLSAATALVATAVAGSAEAERLLDEMPRTIRSLATATAIHHERCRGGLRGPVLWSETMSARASSYGDPDLYVCATPSRAYDVDENRVLVAALVAVRDAAETAGLHIPPTAKPSAAVRRMRRNGHDAGRFVEHPSLHDVSRDTPTGKALKRTRAGKKRKVYEPALLLLRRAANPIGVPEVRARLDERVAAQLLLLTGVLAGLEAQGVRLPPMRVVDGHLDVGGMTLHARRASGPRNRPAGPARALRSGIVAGPLLFDVPDSLAESDRGRAEAALAARAEGRTPILVADEDDLARVVAALVRP
jgi:hypothetical protein